jgi:hypothetical protein
VFAVAAVICSSDFFSCLCVCVCAMIKAIFGFNQAKEVEGGLRYAASRLDDIISDEMNHPPHPSSRRGRRYKNEQQEDEGII